MTVKSGNPGFSELPVAMGTVRGYRQWTIRHGVLHGLTSRPWFAGGYEAALDYRANRGAGGMNCLACVNCGQDYGFRQASDVIQEADGTFTAICPSLLPGAFGEPEVPEGQDHTPPGESLIITTEVIRVVPAQKPIDIAQWISFPVPGKPGPIQPLLFEPMGVTMETVRERHEVACGCGFWAYWSPYDVRARQLFSDSEIIVTGVVEGFGKIIQGTKGFRCQKLKILALAPDREDVNVPELPGTEVYYSLKALVKNFPPDDNWIAGTL